MNSNYDAGCCLPLELLRNIIEHIQPQAALLTTALASSALRADTQRILFTEPRLSTPLSHLLFLDAVTASPSRLALFVKTYTQFDVLNGAEATPQLKRTLRERTTAALNAMIQLQRLAYRGCESEPATEILRGCTFKLRALAWVCHGDDAQVLLREILPHQEALRHLGLLSPGNLSSDDCQAAKSLCPNLVSFAGPFPVLSAFLAGREIKHLQWTVDFTTDLADVDLTSLPPELQDVESLVYYAQSDLPLSSIASHLRSVKSLTMPAYEVLSQGFYFPELAGLRALLLSDSIQPPVVPEASRLEFMATAFQRCKALRYVDWQVGPRRYLRYTVDNLDSREFNAIPATEEEVVPWSDRGCFGCY